MKMTEEIISGMVKELTGSYVIQYHANGPDEEPVTIDFTPPFRRISMVSGLEEALNIKFPEEGFGSQESRRLLEEDFERFEHYRLAIAAHHGAYAR